MYAYIYIYISYTYVLLLYSIEVSCSHQLLDQGRHVGAQRVGGQGLSVV